MSVLQIPYTNQLHGLVLYVDHYSVDQKVPFTGTILMTTGFIACGFQLIIVLTFKCSGCSMRHHLWYCLLQNNITVINKQGEVEKLAKIHERGEFLTQKLQRLPIIWYSLLFFFSLILACLYFLQQIIAHCQLILYNFISKTRKLNLYCREHGI